MPRSSLTESLADAEDSFHYALSSNGAWAGYKSHQNPQFFPKLSSGQSPQIRKFLMSDLRCTLQGSWSHGLAFGTWQEGPESYGGYRTLLLDGLLTDIPST